MVAINAVGAHAVASIFGGAVTPPVVQWLGPFNAINARRSLTAAVVATTVLAFTPFVTAPPETITVDKWFKEFSTPIRFPPALKAGLQQTTAYVNATPVTDSIEARWHYPWSEPVRFLPNLGAARQQAFFAEMRGMTVPEAVLYSKFAFQWSEPVRVPPRLATGLQQVLALHPTPSPFVASGWFNWLSEPVRSLPRLQTGLQQTTAFNPQPFVSFGWDEALSEPVRFPPRLLPSLNLFNSLPTPVTPSPAFLLEGWFNWLSEPVRFPQGLKAHLQQTVAMPPRLLPPPVITGTFAATEAFDTFAASGVMFNQVRSAGVGIIDIFPSSAVTGVIDTTPISANVGQVTQQTSTASGTVVAPSTAANVSIKVV